MAMYRLTNPVRRRARGSRTHIAHVVWQEPDDEPAAQTPTSLGTRDHR